jgi:cobalamin biosynthesis Mg chelatase CobN
MRTANGSFYGHTPSTTTQNYSPSVPLSVYRELAAELQAAQAKINALTAQNQQIVQENQLLRQEIAKAVQSVLHLQNLLDASSQSKSQQVPQTQVKADAEVAYPSVGSRQKTTEEPQKFAQSREFAVTPAGGSKHVATSSGRQQVNHTSKTPAKKPQPQPQHPHPRPAVAYTEMEFPVSMPEPVLVEEQEMRTYSSSEPEPERINSWWFFVAIALVIILGFGAGYLVVRPFFEHQSH